MKKIELMCVAPRTLPARHGHAEVVMAEAVITIIEVIAVMDRLWTGIGRRILGGRLRSRLLRHQEVVQAAPQARADNYWHYWRNPEGYYPYVKNCPDGWIPDGWMQGPPQPPAQ